MEFYTQNFDCQVTLDCQVTNCDGVCSVYIEDSEENFIEIMDKKS